MTRAIVIGGGLAGLACGHALARGDVEVTVLEAGDRPGGVTGTDEVAGFRFERGPNTVQAGSRAFRTLCGELGIADRLVPSAPEARQRWLFHQGLLRELPSSPLRILTTPLLSLRARLRLFAEPLRRNPWLPDADPEPSLAAFLEERFGPEPTRLFAATFVRGIYAGDIERLGARSAFPRLWEQVVAHGSILRSLAASRKGEPLPGPDVRASRLLSFPRGLQELVDALESALGDTLRTGTRARRLVRRASGVWRVDTDAGPLEAERVVLATPARGALALLEDVADADALAVLRELESASVTLVHLGFGPEARPAFGERGGLPPGFGYLVPPGPRGRPVRSGPLALGTIFVSNLFEGRAPEGCFAVSSFYASSDLAGMEDHSAVRTAEKDLARALRLGDLPRSRVSRVLAWPDAIPQYGIGHDRGVARLERSLGESAPGLWLAGNWIGGVGVEQVIARGRLVAERVLAEERGNDS